MAGGFKQDDERPLVLVVEDELLLSDIIADELEDAGYRVITSVTGEEGLTVLEGPDAIDVLFTDIRLPGKVDGWRLAEAARQLRPGLPIVYASGYSVEQPRDVPGSRFLTKPYRPSTVVQVFQQLGVVGQPD